MLNHSRSTVRQRSRHSRVVMFVVAAVALFAVAVAGGTRWNRIPEMATRFVFRARLPHRLSFACAAKAAPSGAAEEGAGQELGQE